MAGAIDYPITLGFGATSSPYSSASPHHGIDYATPMNTPVIVSGKTIGWTGETGYAFGPHLHVDKNPNYPAAKGYQNPSGWSNITGIVTFVGAAGTAGNMIVIKGDAYYRFLHLNSYNVKVGDKIGEYPMDHEDVNRIFRLWQRDATQAELDYWIGRKPEKLAASIYNDPSNSEFRRKAINYDKDIANALASGTNRTSVIEYVNKNLK